MIRTDLLDSHANPDGAFRIGVSANSGMHTNELIAGVCLALNQAQSKGSAVARSISFLWRDDGRMPDTAAAVAKDFVAEGIEHVIGHLSASASVAASAVYAEHGVLFLAPGTTHPDLCAAERETVFRICGTDASQAAEICAFAGRSFASSDVFLLVQEIAYGHSLAGYLEAVLQTEGRAAKRATVSSERLTTEALSTFDRWRGSVGRPLVILCAIHEFAAQFVTDLRSHGYEGPIVAGDDCHIENFKKLCASPLNDVFIPKLTIDLQDSSSSLASLGDTAPVELMAFANGAYFETSRLAMDLMIDAREAWPDASARTIAKNLRADGSANLTFDALGSARNIGWTIRPAAELFGLGYR